MALARKAKALTITADEITELVAFTKENGGVEYAEKCMNDYHAKAMSFINNKVSDPIIKQSLTAYLDYVIQRNK